jgi:hypothetical protein
MYGHSKSFSRCKQSIMAQERTLHGIYNFSTKVRPILAFPELIFTILGLLRKLLGHDRQR